MDYWHEVKRFKQEQFDVIVDWTYEHAALGDCFDETVSDLENGVASLNEAAAKDFHRRYPLVANFGTTINRIIDGGKDE